MPLGPSVFVSLSANNEDRQPTPAKSMALAVLLAGVSRQNDVKMTSNIFCGLAGECWQVICCNWNWMCQSLLSTFEETCLCFVRLRLETWTCTSLVLGCRWSSYKSDAWCTSVCQSSTVHGWTPPPGVGGGRPSGDTLVITTTAVTTTID